MCVCGCSLALVEVINHRDPGAGLLTWPVGSEGSLD